MMKTAAPRFENSLAALKQTPLMTAMMRSDEERKVITDRIEDLIEAISYDTLFNLRDGI